MISISKGNKKLRKDGRDRKFLNNRIFYHRVHIQHFLSSTIFFVIIKVLHPREKGCKISHRSHTAVKTNLKALNSSVFCLIMVLAHGCLVWLHIIIMSLVLRTVPEIRHFSRSSRFHLWVRKIPCRWKWQSASVFLPGKFQGQRSLVGYIQSMGSQSWTWQNTHNIVI